MSLIKCPECGTDVSEQATTCPKCGHPLSSSANNVTVNIKKEKGAFSSGRLSIGIISIVLFLFISLQSCAVGLGNALSDNEEVSGSAGFLLALCMLISGIIGISTRNSQSKTGAIIVGVIYLFGALIGFCNVGTYSDLQIWSFLTLCFGVFFIICAIRTKKK